MKSINTSFCNEITPTPGAQWVALTPRERFELIHGWMMSNQKIHAVSSVSLVGTKEDGQIIVRLNAILEASQRGTTLLDFESLLKANIDRGLSVWVEPLGDKNSLRNLRGIEVKF